MMVYSFNEIYNNANHIFKEFAMKTSVYWDQILCPLYFANINLLNFQNNSEGSVFLFSVNRLGNANSER